MNPKWFLENIWRRIHWLHLHLSDYFHFCLHGTELVKEVVANSGEEHVEVSFLYDPDNFYIVSICWRPYICRVSVSFQIKDIGPFLRRFWAVFNEFLEKWSHIWTNTSLTKEIGNNAKTTCRPDSENFEAWQLWCDETRDTLSRFQFSLGMFYYNVFQNFFDWCGVQWFTLFQLHLWGVFSPIETFSREDEEIYVQARSIAKGESVNLSISK